MDTVTRIIIGLTLIGYWDPKDSFRHRYFNETRTETLPTIVYCFIRKERRITHIDETNGSREITQTFVLFYKNS